MQNLLRQNSRLMDNIKDLAEANTALIQQTSALIADKMKLAQDLSDANQRVQNLMAKLQISQFENNSTAGVPRDECATHVEGVHEQDSFERKIVILERTCHTKLFSPHPAKRNAVDDEEVNLIPAHAQANTVQASPKRRAVKEHRDKGKKKKQ
ncbi:hypothetical protein EsH8_X_000125 [Colletotrichum jinshuiense]